MIISEHKPGARGVIWRLSHVRKKIYRSVSVDMNRSLHRTSTIRVLYQERYWQN
jgi:hypothetical protein